MFGVGGKKRVCFDEFAYGVSGSAPEFPTFSRATRGRDLSGRGKPMIPRGRLPMPSRPLEVRKKRVRKKFNECPLGNVPPMTAHGGDLILHMHCVYLSCPVP